MPDRINGTLGICGCCGTQPGGGGGGGGGGWPPGGPGGGSSASRFLAFGTRNAIHHKYGFREEGQDPYQDDGTRYLTWDTSNGEGLISRVEISRFGGATEYRVDRQDYPVPTQSEQLDEYEGADFESDADTLCAGQGNAACANYAVGGSQAHIWDDGNSRATPVSYEQNGIQYRGREINPRPNGDTICIASSGSFPNMLFNPFRWWNGAVYLIDQIHMSAGKIKVNAPGGSWRSRSGDPIAIYCRSGLVQYYDPLDFYADVSIHRYSATIPSGHAVATRNRMPSSISAPTLIETSKDIRNTDHIEPVPGDNTLMFFRLNSGNTLPVPRTYEVPVCFGPFAPSFYGVSDPGDGTLQVFWEHDEAWVKFELEVDTDPAFSAPTLVTTVDREPDEPIVHRFQPGATAWGNGIYHGWKETVVPATPGVDHYYRVRAYYHSTDSASAWGTVGSGNI